MATISQRSAVPSFPDARHTPPDVMLVLFLLAVVLAPFQFRLGVGNFTVFDAVILVTAVLIVVTRRPVAFLPPGFAVAACVFLLFALVSTLRSTEPSESLTQILQFAFVFFVQLPVILTVVPSWRIVRASLVLLVLVRLVEVLGSFMFSRVSGSQRALSLEGDSANKFAYPTAYLLPFMLALLLTLWRRRHRLATVVVGAPTLYLMLWALMASGSRSATLATCVGLVAFLAFRQRSDVSLATLGRLGVAVLLVGAAGYSVYQSDYFPATLRHRIELTMQGEASLTEDRLELAAAALRAFVESPLVGVGLDNFRYVAHEYGALTVTTDAHNMWIDLLVKVGLIGAAAFGVLVVAWFIALVRAQRTSDDLRARELIGAFIGSMLAVMTIHLFVPMMLQRHYWLLYGLGLALASGVTPRRESGVTARTD
jgi:O-antigen ligase